MDTVATYAVVIAASYVFGAIPWGVVLGKLLYHTDIRHYGSGNIGFTNALRTLNPGVSLGIFLADFSKGVLPVLVTRLIWHDPYLQFAGACAAMFGHVCSFLIHFRGGKGVATAVGAVLALTPLTLIPMVVFILPFMFISRYVSLTVLIFSPLVTLFLLILALLDVTPFAYFLFAAVATAIIVYRHRDNIRRLRSGTETKLGWRAQKAAS